VLSANPAGRPAQLLPIALARYLDRSGRRPAPGIAYLAFLATMPLTGVVGDVCGPRRAIVVISEVGGLAERMYAAW